MSINQYRFIKNWNKTSKILSNKYNFGLLPELPTDGICCGFSFLLAECIKMKKENEFYRFFSNVCNDSPEQLSQQIFHSGNNTFLDWIYKLYILHFKQYDYAGCANLNDTQSWAFFHCNTPNHQRIGNKNFSSTTNYGQLKQYPLLKQLLYNLKEDESLEIGLHHEKGSHSILIYRANHCINIFDADYGQLISNCSVSLAMKTFMQLVDSYSSNEELKPKSLDNFLNRGTLAQFLAFSLLLPIMPFWILYDVIFSNKSQMSRCQSAPVNNDLIISWGKIGF